MISEGAVHSLLTSPQQITTLLALDRIKSVPGTGICLLPRDALASLATRRPKTSP